MWRLRVSSLAKTAVFGTSAVVLCGTAYAQARVKAAEVAKHDKPDDLWVAVNGQVYNLTEFKAAHPGGAKILEKYAGTDASEIFNKFHAKDLPEKLLDDDQKLGELDGELKSIGNIMDASAGDREHLEKNKPPLEHLMNPNDFEYVAKRLISQNAWSYYSSAADDQITFRENHDAFKRIFFKPRVCVDVTDVDMTTEFFGEKVPAPFYCSAAAQAKMGHESGELGIARGCGRAGIPQMISNYASYPMPQIAGQIKGQTQWFQMYSEPEEEKNKENIDSAVNHGLKAIFVTVDTPQLGHREKDLKLKAEQGLSDGGVLGQIHYGAAHPVTWERISAWRHISKVPIVLKGVGSVEDVVKAAEQGIPAVVLSNHGGRQLDFARAPIEVLADTMPVLREKGLDGKIDIYIDGGARRGSDILKAVALGAKGVGFGRLFLYANSAYGEEGVQRLCEMLQEEIHMNMQLLGVTSLSELGPQHLDLRSLYSRSTEQDMAFYENYEPVGPPKFKFELPK